MRKIIIDDIGLEITHGDKVLFPQSNITKNMVIKYYLKVADKILPFIKDRPLTINCFPNGIGQEGFFRQHAPEDLPEWFETIMLEKKSGGLVNHILCNNQASLIYLINLNTIAIHRWLSIVSHPNYPDTIVIDIDPSIKRFSLACKAAWLLKKSLERDGFQPQVMTTGSRGLHVFSVVEPKKDFEEVREYLGEIVSEIAERYPNDFSVDVRRRYREDLVYLDIFRNAYGQTAVAPFSIRAKEGAPIAMPLEWDDLNDKTLTSQKYNISNY
jgi:bifunctional non-homologous end joining protein LigD